MTSQGILKRDNEDLFFRNTYGDFKFTGGDPEPPKLVQTSSSPTQSLYAEPDKPLRVKVVGPN